MIIKRKLQEQNKEFGMKIYTLTYIKLIMKKNLLNRIGNSTGKKICNILYEEKNRKSIDIHV